MKNRILIKLATVTFTLLVLNQVASAQIFSPPGENPRLTSLVEKGIKENDGLKSKFDIAAAKKDESGAAGSLENPRIGFSMLNLPSDSFETDAEPMTQKQIFIAQKIPWFGKRDLKTEIKLHEAKQLSAGAQSFKSTLAWKIRSLYYDISLLKESILINQRITLLVENSLKSLEEAYGSGRSSREQILKMQIHHSNLLEERIFLNEKLITSKNRLSELVELPQDFQFTLPDRISGQFTQAYFSKLKEKALSENPELLKRKAGIDKADAMVREADKNYFPDMDLKFSYGQRDEAQNGMERSDFLSASVTFSIPLWKNSRQDNIKASKSNILKASKHEERDYKKTLELRINTQIEKIKASERGFRLTGELIEAQLSELQASSGKGYETGSSSFESVMDSKIKVLKNRLKKLRYIADFYKLNAEITALASY
jgi:outer membrane protein TolC